MRAAGGAGFAADAMAGRLVPATLAVGTTLRGPSAVGDPAALVMAGVPRAALASWLAWANDPPRH
jgi:hypothetical protein